MHLKDNEKIFLVPMAKKRYAQFSFMPATTMEALLKDCNIPFEQGTEPFKGKRLIKANRTEITRYVVPFGKMKKLYYFSFVSNVIDQVLQYYNIGYCKNIEISKVVKDLQLDIEEINTRKIKNKIQKETNKDMNKYKARQIKSKLENWYICKELELKCNTWNDIKSGKRSLTGKKLDKFLELTDPVKQTWLTQESEKKKIDAWYQENRKNIGEMMDNFGVNNVIVGNDIGVDNSTISNIKRGVGNLQASYLLYYYLQDESNKRHTRTNKKSTTIQSNSTGGKRGRKPHKITPEEIEAVNILKDLMQRKHVIPAAEGLKLCYKYNFSNRVIAGIKEMANIEPVQHNSHWYWQDKDYKGPINIDTQESDGGNFVMNDGNLTITDYNGPIKTYQEPMNIADILSKDVTPKAVVEAMSYKPDNRDVLIDKLENQLTGLKSENEKLSEELARYRYLIDLAMQSQNNSFNS